MYIYNFTYNYTSSLQVFEDEKNSERDQTDHSLE
jgi:hypothetical protein